MKKHINLITRQRKYYQIDQIVRYARIAIAAFGAIFIVLNLVFFALLYSEQSALTALTNEKKTLLDYLIRNKESEARFMYFNTKERQVATILKSDVNFYPYYSLLTESLSTASPAGRLATLVINTNKKVTFSVSFDNYGSLLGFFKFMETDAFLKNFKDLTLVSAETGAREGDEVYMLNLEGTFHELL